MSARRPLASMAGVVVLSPPSRRSSGRRATPDPVAIGTLTVAMPGEQTTRDPTPTGVGPWACVGPC
jgi:hypothetical protein